MTHILSGARKYRVGLILAHQDLQQVQKNDGELLNALIANAGTRICFRLGDTDARKMAEGFSFFDAHDLQNLNVGEAIVRIERPEFDFSLSTHSLESSQETYTSKEMIIAHSRNTYSTPKQDVENMLKESMNSFEIAEQLPEVKSEPAKQTPPTFELPIVSESTMKSKTTLPFQPSEYDTSTVVKKKEDTQHRYLQTLIKKMAEAKGYKAVIEMPTSDGKGSVDVHIEGNDLRIACEVSVTTDSNWERHNIEKCLGAGYDFVVVCCSEKKSVDALQKKVQETFAETIRNKIIIGEPQIIFDWLDQSTVQQAPTETKMKGYRVKVEYDAISHDAMKQKKDSITKVIADAMKKIKKIGEGLHDFCIVYPTSRAFLNELKSQKVREYLLFLAPFLKYLNPFLIMYRM